MKTTARIALGLFLSIAVILALAGAILGWVNRHDEEPRPEVAQILAAPPPAWSEKQLAAYFFALGAHAGADTGAYEETGRKLFTEFHALQNPEQRGEFWFSRIAVHPPWTKPFLGCEPNGKVCTVEFVKKYTQIEREMEVDTKDLESYDELMNYGEIGKVFAGSPEIVFPKIWLVAPQMHHKLLLQTAIWISHGQDKKAFALLTNSNHYLAQLAQSGNLFDTAAAVASIKQTAEFLKTEKLRRPQVKFPSDLVKSFNLPDSEILLKGALAQELLTFKNFSEQLSLGHTPAAKTPGLKPMVRAVVPVTRLLLPNESLNHFYDLTKCEHADCPERAYLQPRPHYLSYIKNPVGRELLRVMDPHLEVRRGKLEENLKTIAEIQAELR